MSTKQNDELLDRASEMVEYWAGTLHEKLILNALNSNDLDLVRQYTSDAEAEASKDYMYSAGIFTPEELYERAESILDERRENGEA